MCSHIHVSKREECVCENDKDCVWERERLGEQNRKKDTQSNLMKWRKNILCILKKETDRIRDRERGLEIDIRNESF